MKFKDFVKLPINPEAELTFLYADGFEDSLTPIYETGPNGNVVFLPYTHARRRIGVEEGDVCNRSGCSGVLIPEESKNCSCHINPPCSSCTDCKIYCPMCLEVVADE